MSNNNDFADGKLERRKAKKYLKAFHNQQQLIQQKSEARIQTGAESEVDSGASKHQTGDSEKQKNFDQKIYMFPESYNQLRIELATNWPHLWELTAWRMAYKAEEFVEIMNAALDLAIVLDSDKVGWICTQYLNALRKKRGLS